MSNSLIIKVCGMREAENIREVDQLSIFRSALPLGSSKNCQLSINWMGFIFWPKSKRYVNKIPDYMPVNAKRVGVFVDEEIETIQRIADDYALDILQLHGSESPEQISQLSIVNCQLSIIKAFNIATAEDFEQTKAYEGLVDYFLFDTKGQSVGGNGAKFDWDVLTHYTGSSPFLLSGGIGPEDAEAVRTFHHPRCIGIDLNSRFETAPGVKDVARLKEFMYNLNTK